MSTIYQDRTIESVQNLTISLFASNTIDDFSFSIVSTVLFGNPDLTYTIFPNSASSEIEFGEIQLNQFVYPDSIESTLVFQIDESILKYPQTIFLEARIELFNRLGLEEFETLEDYSSNTIQEVINEYERGIESTIQMGEEYVVRSIIRPNLIEVTSVVEDVELKFIIDFDSINPTIQFGGFTQLNMEIDNVPFPSIESTVIIPNPDVIPLIQPLGLASTTNFDTPSFIDNIHRILVFKDDNISKIGENDATVISGGIRLNPASTASNTATSGSSSLPEAPVGFLSINIGGVDYKVPYYNS